MSLLKKEETSFVIEEQDNMYESNLTLLKLDLNKEIPNLQVYVCNIICDYIVNSKNYGFVDVTINTNDTDIGESPSFLFNLDENNYKEKINFLLSYTKENNINFDSLTCTINFVYKESDITIDLKEGNSSINIWFDVPEKIEFDFIPILSNLEEKIKEMNLL